MYMLLKGGLLGRLFCQSFVVAFSDRIIVSTYPENALAEISGGEQHTKGFAPDDC